MNLTFKNINKTFLSLRGKIEALHNINLEIKKGEFFVLLGPSGCGKSTLLNLAAGLEKPTQGTIKLEDKTLADAKNKIFTSPKERNVAFVFQSYALYPHMSVYENIAFPLRIARQKEDSIKKQVEQTAALLEIGDLLPAKPGELSGGQRQRVAIARAIVRHPSLFLMDEPLSNLDTQLRISMRAELKNIQKKLGVTTIYVTHDQIEAMSLGDRIALLRNGRIEQIGTAEELYDKPANSFTGKFIGTPPMNLFEINLKTEKSKYFISTKKTEFMLDKQFSSVFDKKKSGDYTMGIRPEDIRITSAGTEKSVLQGKINTVEQLGREVLLHINWEKHDLTILSSRKNLHEGDIINFYFDPEKTHLFS